MADQNLMKQGVADAVDQSQYANNEEQAQKDALAQENVVKALLKEYDDSRRFDEAARTKYAIDRRFASGAASKNFAVTANLIGSFIDILVSFLYARDPDVSVRKSPQVKTSGTEQQDDFARTMELVISSLWKRGNLKKQCRKQVRSALSIGPGFLKVVMRCDDGMKTSQMRSELNTLQDNIKRYESDKTALMDMVGENASDEEIDAKMAELTNLENSLTNKIEASVRKYLAIDFVAAQDFQCSTDVSTVADHLEAEWNSNAIYRTEAKVLLEFGGENGNITKEDLKSATKYFQRKPANSPLSEAASKGMDFGDGLKASDADQFTTGQGQEGSQAFYKVVEIWDKRDNHIKTMIEGVKSKFACDPYEPSYASSRFYPFFYLGFFEVDDERHPQSLTERLLSLQDEYSRSRSNFRLTRERSVPGVLFNAAQLDPTEAQKLEKSTIQEYIGLNPLDSTIPLGNLFAPKPVAGIDMRVYDNTMILQDMEKISGVQEALQSSMGATGKTATQVETEQQGFASRTTADRDSLEHMLTDLAQYTAECSIQCLEIEDAQRICGVGAYWPHGMSIDDLLTEVEITIEAGSTGKPKKAGDKEAWGVVLPTIKETIQEIVQAIAMGQIPVAKCLSELVRETMRRMGDDTDVDKFLPPIPDMGMPGIPGLPGAAGAPGAAPPVPGSPAVPTPGAGMPGPGAPSVPDLQNPDLQNPEIQPPV